MFTVAVVMGYNPNTMSVAPQIKENKATRYYSRFPVASIACYVDPPSTWQNVSDTTCLEDFAEIVCPALFIFLSKSQVGLAGMAARVAHSPLTPFFSQIVENKR